MAEKFFVRRMRDLICIFVMFMFATLAAEEIELTKASIGDLQAAMDKGALTAEALVNMYLSRIEAYDKKGPKINAVLAISPNAVEIARALDKERKEKGPRSPLHGIPVIVKDVFDTYDMPTTGGYAPLKEVIPAKDAAMVKRLRDAGAIILAKVNQSDWYAQPDIMASSTLGGSTLNPFALDRTPGWSSAGTGAGLAAHFGKVGLGSETGFSIRTPTSDSNLFGLSTTSGLISRAGQMWSYITGERGGPMSHSMYDLAVTLDVVAGFDSADLWTANSLGKIPEQPYVSFLDKNGLKGARVGVLKEAWDFSPVDPQVVEMAKSAIKVFADNGAKVFEPVSLNIDLVNYLQINSSPSRYERIAAIDAYLAQQGPDYPFKNARQLLLGHAGIPTRPNDVEALNNPIDLDRDPGYRATLQGRIALRDMVIALLDRYQLDALIFPHKLAGPLKIGPRTDPERQYVPNQLSPNTGLPALIVPMGFTAKGLPVGLEILGRPWSEPTLIKIASGFEAVTDNRRVPKSTPPLQGEVIRY
ncbi:MAG: amidase family protein [Cellvibrionaceae bacterium]|nr:amidase family protein [Cellvibrionaceae bacterium]